MSDDSVVVSMRDRLAQDNERALQALLANGLHPSAINAVVMKARLETLVECLFTAGSDGRDAFETAAQVTLRNDLGNLMGEVKQALLAEQSGLIVPSVEVPPDLTTPA